MEDILKSGFLGLALIGTLILASNNAKEIKKQDAMHKAIQIEKIVIADDKNDTSKAKVKEKEIVETPM